MSSTSYARVSSNRVEPSARLSSSRPSCSSASRRAQKAHIQDATSRTPAFRTSPAAATGWKSLFDLALILLGLPLILPVMALIALWVKLVSRGPAIFRQTRIGRDGVPFTLYKFRSMRVDAPVDQHLRHIRNLVANNRPLVKLDLLCDRRLIPGGCLLRAAGLDELPQIYNILRGEMSLVGPRPCIPDEYPLFNGGRHVRFRVLPGLTGIWQSQGKNLATFSEMTAMDARYVASASPLLDLAIICRTPAAVFGQVRLAYHRHRAAKAAAAPVPQVDEKPLAAAFSTQRLG